MRINISLLRERLEEKKLSISEFSRAIGINPSTFYRKAEKGGETFTVGQMHKTGEVLGLSGAELNAIFLFDNSQ